MIEVLLGNLALVGFTGLVAMQNDPFIDILTRPGVLLLLFEVGLEFTVGQMLKVGLSSFLVATLGVAAPARRRPRGRRRLRPVASARLQRGCRSTGPR